MQRLDLPDLPYESRTQLEAARKKELSKLLKQNLQIPAEFLEELRQLVFTPEGYEDLGWTITVYEAAQRQVKGDPELRVLLLIDYAEALEQHQQWARSRKILEEALRFVTDDAHADLRASVLCSLSDVLYKMGESDLSNEALSAARTDAEKTNKPNHRLLGKIASALANQGKTAAAHATIQRLQTLLEKSGAIENAEDRWEAWRRIEEFGEEHNSPDLRLLAMRKLLDLDPIPERAAILYEATNELRDNEKLEEYTQYALDSARQADPSGGAIRTLIEFAAVDAHKQRLDLAQQRIDEARKLISKSAHRRYKADWNERIEEVRSKIQQLRKGKVPIDSAVSFQFVDEDEEPIELSDAQRAARIMELVEAQASGQQKELIHFLLGRDSQPKPKRLKDQIAHLDRVAGEGRPMPRDAWSTIQRAIEKGKAEWAANYLKRCLEIQAAGDAHPFAIQSMMDSLLDAFEQSKSWDEGRKWLSWWRNLIGRIDHPESSRMDQIFDTERQWEVRAGSPQAAAQILQRQIAYLEATRGPKHPNTQRLRRK